MSRVFIVGAVAFCTLVLELVISRLSVFYLDYSTSMIAIPVALLGLAMGGLYIHLFKRPGKPIDIQLHLQLFLLVSFLAFVDVFYIFSQVFQFERSLFMYRQSLLYFKTLVFILIFVAPFFFAGTILTELFTQGRKEIGRIYAADLLGAALACFLTPFFFHYFDLPYLILVYFLILVACIALNADNKRRRLLHALVLTPASVALTFIIIYFESGYHLNGLVGVPLTGKPVQEIAHRWNEYSRVSLLKVVEGYYRIIHDNAESNVYLNPYVENSPNQYNYSITYMPYLVDSSPKDVLVMFAGGGAQMVEFYGFNQGTKTVDGVEINPLVKEFSLHKELKEMKLKEFYSLPNVNLIIQEGRQFLIHSDKKYDLIYVASDAATSTYKTGHSRKYLDTMEAMEAYIDKLTDSGMLMFQSKPSWPKVKIMKEIFERKGLDFMSSVLVLSDHPYSPNNVWHHILLKKTPYKPEDIEKILAHFPSLHAVYVPYFPEKSNRDFTAFLRGDSYAEQPVYYNLRPTDDNPYYSRLSFAEFKFLPDMEILNSPLGIVSWMKIQTLVMIVGLALMIFVMLAIFKRDRMPPVSVFLYLLVSGFCYMLCQIIFIGKLELFLEKPLYSMALLISVFLLTNAAGSWISQKLDRLSLRNVFAYYPFFVAVVTLVCLLLSDYAVVHLIHLPLAVKIIIVILLISPVGFCLGVFYPYAVTWLSRNNREDAIPVTYGLSTLSSVVGATYAMTVVINVGYSPVLYQAVLGYILLSALMLLVKPKMI